MNDTSEYLKFLQTQKKDLSPTDFKVCIDDTLFTITPEMVAEMFCSMSSEEQAVFFNSVHDIGTSWHGGAFSMQLQYITDEQGLNLGGRAVMQSIGDYSHWGLVPHASLEFRKRLCDG